MLAGTAGTIVGGLLWRDSMAGLTNGVMIGGLSEFGANALFAGTRTAADSFKYLRRRWAFEAIRVKQGFGGGTEVSLEDLDEIKVALQGKGISVKIGADSVLKRHGADAMYDLEDRVLYFKARPSRIQVLEEMIHLSQHRQSGWRIPTDLEKHIWDIDAKYRILNMREVLQLTDDEQVLLSVGIAVHRVQYFVLRDCGIRLSDSDAVDIVDQFLLLMD